MVEMEYQMVCKFKPARLRHALAWCWWPRRLPTCFLSSCGSRPSTTPGAALSCAVELDGTAIPVVGGILPGMDFIVPPKAKIAQCERARLLREQIVEKQHGLVEQIVGHPEIWRAGWSKDA